MCGQCVLSCYCENDWHTPIFIVRSKLYCTQNGLSPVYVASQEGHTDVVELLVQAGADIHLATTDDEVSDDSHTVSSSV